MITHILKNTKQIGWIESWLRTQECLFFFQQTQVRFPADPGAIPSTHVAWLTTTCNSSSKGSDTCFWLPWESVLTCTDSHIHT